MYSKERGMTSPAVLRPRGSPAYRQPPRERLQVPLNYSGHAIVDGEEQPLGMAIARESDLTAAELPALGDPPIPRFDGLPRVSELGDGRRHRSPSYAADVSVSDDSVGLFDAAAGEDGAGEGPFTTNPHKKTSAPTNSHEIPSAPTNPHIFPSAPTNFHPAPSINTDHHPSPSAATRTPLRFGGILSLGTEELLLFGLILFLLREGEACPERGDLEETVILLGLLLLLG